MLISLQQKLVLLAMPKTASTSIETELASYCHMHFKKNPTVKHMPFRRYKRFIEPYLEEIGYSNLETACLIREPISWVFSWYKYRNREDIVDPKKSSAGLTFDEFALGYMGEYKDFPGFGRQWHFLSDINRKPSVDKVFRYENLNIYKNFLEERFAVNIDFPILNASPEKELILSSYMRNRLETYLSPEYEIYESAIAK